MDTAQLVLLFVVFVLTLLLIVLGVQVFFILRDLRRTVRKANKVLDDTSYLAEKVSGPIMSLSTVISGLKAGASVAKLLKKRKSLLSKILEYGEENGEE